MRPETIADDVLDAICGQGQAEIPLGGCHPNAVLV